jgi:hypothetical protein
MSSNKISSSTLAEKEQLLNIKELVIRWHFLFPEKFNIQAARSTNEALRTIECTVYAYIKGIGAKKLNAVIKPESIPKRGGVVAGGVDGVERKHPMELVNSYYFDIAEVERFESYVFLQNEVAEEGSEPKTGLHPCQDQDSEFYAFELDIALQAWYAIAVSKQGEGGTAKQRLESWLRNSGYNLTDKQIDRISIVCNFYKLVGRPKANK